MPAWQRALSRFFANVWIELAIGGLIVVSVVLTLIEFMFDASANGAPVSPAIVGVQWVNHGLTCVFIVELVLRYLSVMSPRRFLREYWIDLVAVLPSLLPSLDFTKLMRLVRLLRILRLFGFVSRLSSNFPYILRRGAVEYFTVCGLLVLTVLVGAGALALAESDQADGGMSFRRAFWFSLYSLFASEPIPAPPVSLAGKIITVFIMFMGLTIFAMFTGTVSAFMVERLRTKGRNVDWDTLRDHVIICGWNTKAEIILEEFAASGVDSDAMIVVVAQWEHDPPNLPAAQQARVVFFNDDFTRVAVLKQVGIHRAKTCIILADTTHRSEQDADARTILAALTVEKLNADVYTCAELHHADYGSHLEMGHVNDYVVSTEHSAYLMAQAALSRGLVGVFAELLTHQRGNQFYRLPLTPDWHGRTFDELMPAVRTQHQALLVGVHREEGGVLMNPKSYTFAAGDEIVVIAEREFELLARPE